MRNIVPSIVTLQRRNVDLSIGGQRRLQNLGVAMHIRNNYTVHELYFERELIIKWMNSDEEAVVT